MDRPAVYFREIQTFNQWWLWVFLPLVPAIFLVGSYRQVVQGKSWGNHAVPDAALLTITAAVVLSVVWFSLMRFVTEVREGELSVWWQFVSRERRIPLDAIRASEAVLYDPAVDSNGWVCHVSGSRGVRLELASRKRLLIGSQKPDDLAAAIAQAKGAATER